jgi:hypothetical protein
VHSAAKVCFGVMERGCWCTLVCVCARVSGWGVLCVGVDWCVLCVCVGVGFFVCWCSLVCVCSGRLFGPVDVMPYVAYLSCRPALAFSCPPDKRLGS